jgi:hypothetical protein
MVKTKQAVPLTPAEKRTRRENTDVEVVYKIDHEYFQSIERVLSRELSNEQLAEIDKALRIWTAARKYLPKTEKELPRIPSSNELIETKRQKIEGIREKTLDLIDALEESGHLIESWKTSGDVLDCPYPIGKAIDGLYLILRFAEAAQKKEGKPTGEKFRNQRKRPPEIYRHDFIKRLAVIYNDITGKEAKHYKSGGAYSGPFFRFVDACINPVESLSNLALGNAINTALKNHR